MSFFSNARQTTIEGGQFVSVLQGDANFHIGDPNGERRRGLEILHQHVAAGAFHDAAERIDPPKCHPHTRRAILNEIQEWVRSVDGRRTFIIWLYGPAGSGKSAISQTVAELFAEEGLLVASFFFSRTSSGRNDTSKFIASMAYQLSLSVPTIRGHIAAAVEQDPLVFSRTLSSQMQALVIKPLNDSATKLDPYQPRLVIVDGLDEARQETTQKELLDTLAAAINQLHIPLIFIVASRPEYVIRQAFNREPLRSLMRGLALDEHYKPDDDIRTFLASKFAEIKQSHASGNGLPEPWPSKDDMDYLILKSSGQFIFASTVIKYIDSPRHNPARRLKIILGLYGPGKDTPFAQLDALYNLILSSVDDIPRVLEILALVFLQKNYDVYLTVDFIETLLGYESGDVIAALTDMHALVHVPTRGGDDDDDDHRLHMYHASFHDFLMDKSRAGHFFIDARERHVDLAGHLFHYITTTPTTDYGDDQFIAALNGFVEHCLEVSNMDELSENLESFSLAHFLSNIPVKTFYATKWDALFHHLRTACVDSNPDLYERLQDEFDTWIRTRYEQYPEFIQTCISAAYAIRGAWTVSYLPDIFDILTHSLPLSAAFDLRKLDMDLFMFSDISSLDHADFNGLSVLRNFFCEPSRARNLFADGTKFVKLAEALAKMLCQRGDDSLRIVVMDRPYFNDLTPSAHSKWYSTLQIDYGSVEFFPKILDVAPVDISLAQLLWDIVVPYKHNDSIANAREKMSFASLEYILKCGASLPDHVHRADCQVCQNYRPKFTELAGESMERSPFIFPKSIPRVKRIPTYHSPSRALDSPLPQTIAARNLSTNSAHNANIVSNPNVVSPLPVPRGNSSSHASIAAGFSIPHRPSKSTSALFLSPSTNPTSSSSPAILSPYGTSTAKISSKQASMSNLIPPQGKQRPSTSRNANASAEMLPQRSSSAGNTQEKPIWKRIWKSAK